MKNILFYIIFGISAFIMFYGFGILILAYDNLRYDFIFINFHNFLFLLLIYLLNFIIFIDIFCKFKECEKR